MKCLRRLVEFQITSSTQNASYVMKQVPTIKQWELFMEMTSAKIECVDASSTLSNRFRKKKNEVPLEMRETFIETCKQLCTVTMVAKYKVLKGRLKEMAETVPTLYSWIEWWDDRRAHIFGPYRGGGLPGCNLSKQGNAQ